MKILILADTHGRDKWSLHNPNEYDKIIFLGDYVDSYDIPADKQINNLKNIIQFQKDYPDKVITLLGNHDWHYLNGDLFPYETYSGFQQKYYLIYKNLLEQLDLKLAYKIQPVLFTHAGVSDVWYDKWSKDLDIGHLEIDERLNYIYKVRPESLNFQGTNMYGDNVTQSPIWIRPNSLMKTNFIYTQVVGHTIHAIPQEVNNFVFTDSPNYYVTIEDYKFKIHKYET